jgi:excisionase family DNA binding protein
MSNTGFISQPTLYTVEEAAKQLRVSRWMIYQLLRNNELKSLTIASRRFIASDDLVDFVKQHKEEFHG